MIIEYNSISGICCGCFCFGYSTVLKYRGEIDMCRTFALFPDAESVKQNMSELIDSFISMSWNKE